MEDFLAILVYIIGGIALIVALSALFAWPVQLLWNGCLVGAISGVSEITFLQAWGISILSGMLFKNVNIEKLNMSKFDHAVSSRTG